ncbi:MAG: nickel-dependent hydrogenase large subunit, partial [Desulfuromonas sp.]
ENSYLPDVLATARMFPQYLKFGRGVENFLAFGVFREGESNWLQGGTVSNGIFSPLDLSQIEEDVHYSRYSSDSSGPPDRSRTTPEPHKPQAYSWLKAPRYNKQPFEVGPLARLIVADQTGNRSVSDQLNAILKEVKADKTALPSVFGRHATRAVEALLVADRMETWLNNLAPGSSSVAPYTPRPEASGIGLTEAPRGALGHWIEIKQGIIAHYQCLVPSTWNFSPRDRNNIPGPVEAALEGEKVDSAGPSLELARVVRSFDPCIACAVH